MTHRVAFATTRYATRDRITLDLEKMVQRQMMCVAQNPENHSMEANYVAAYNTRGQVTSVTLPAASRSLIPTPTYHGTAG